MTQERGKNSRTDDTSLFREAVGEVRPVASRRQALQKPAPKPRARFRRADEASVLRESLVLDEDSAGLEQGDELMYRRRGVPERVLRQLRRGHYRVQDEIDLHGMTSPQARESLRDFLGEARERGLGCVRVIHGKGLRSGPAGPVLKSSVSRWLRQVEAVQAFGSAPRRDGGTGALYVLLSW
jgi:DNA-nicking Smr family endonuclease